MVALLVAVLLMLPVAVRSDKPVGGGGDEDSAGTDTDGSLDEYEVESAPERLPARGSAENERNGGLPVQQGPPPDERHLARVRRLRSLRRRINEERQERQLGLPQGKLTVVRNANNFLGEVNQDMAKKMAELEQERLETANSVHARAKGADLLREEYAKNVEALRLEKVKQAADAKFARAKLQLQEEEAKDNINAIKKRAAEQEKQSKADQKLHDSIKARTVRPKFADEFCLAVKQNDVREGQDLQLWVCDDTKTSQRFKLYPDKTVRTDLDHLFCVTRRLGTSVLEINKCDAKARGEDQRFTVMRDGTLRLKADERLAVTVQHGVMRDGQVIELRTAEKGDGHPDQSWQLTAVGEKAMYTPKRTLRLDEGKDKMCLTAKGIKDGDKLVLSECGKHKHEQEWRMPSDGALRLARRPSICLEVRGDDRSDLRVGSCGAEPKDGQRFSLTKAGFLEPKRGGGEGDDDEDGDEGDDDGGSAGYVTPDATTDGVPVDVAKDGMKWVVE